MTTILLTWRCENCPGEGCECDQAEQRIEAERHRLIIASLQNLSPREKRERLKPNARR